MAAIPKFTDVLPAPGFAGRASAALRERAAALAWHNPLYRWSLQGPSPQQITIVPPDTWPGDAARGLLIAQQGPVAAGLRGTALHGFDWLRDLRAAGGEGARACARTLIDGWIASAGSWRREAMEAEVTGARLASWISFHDFYAAGAERAFLARVYEAAGQQLRHLQRITPGRLHGIAALGAARGMLAAALNMPRCDRTLAAALDWIMREITGFVAPDGGVAARCPEQLLAALRLLIDVRGALTAAQITPPNDLQLAIQRMVPALRLLRHGDGGLALFHGGQEGAELVIDSVITQSEVRARAARSLPQTGYERVAAGRSLLIMDTGAPPAAGNAHAAPLSFEFSVGKQRVVVNCGGAPQAPEAWCKALSCAAAHTALTVNGVDPDWARVSAQRYEQDGMHYIETVHDGYDARFGLMHHRTLALSADGELLQARELLRRAEGRAARGFAACDFTLRLHLHPDVQASAAQGGQTVLLRLDGGQGWRFRVAEGSCAIEESVYGGRPGTPPANLQRSKQIVVHGRTGNSAGGNDETELCWQLQREGR